jgi:integrase
MQDFHDLRSIELTSRADIKTLQSDMGHRSIQTTLYEYCHVNEDMKRQAADKRSALLKVISDYLTLYFIYMKTNFINRL